MKTTELRTKSADELKAQLLDLRKEQLNYRFQQTTGQLEKSNGIRIARRTIAKIQTILAEMKSGKTVAAKAPKAPKAAKAPAKKKSTKE